MSHDPWCRRRTPSWTTTLPRQCSAHRSSRSSWRWQTLHITHGDCGMPTLACLVVVLCGLDLLVQHAYVCLVSEVTVQTALSTFGRWRHVQPPSLVRALCIHRHEKTLILGTLSIFLDDLRFGSVWDGTTEPEGTNGPGLHLAIKSLKPIIYIPSIYSKVISLKDKISYTHERGRVIPFRR